MPKILPAALTAFVVCFAATALGPGALAAGESELVLALDAANEFRYGPALFHFKRAAEQGNMQAQRSAGLMLLKGEALYGEEVTADRAEAVKWLRLAADRGCAVSEFILARPMTAGTTRHYLGGKKGDRS